MSTKRLEKEINELHTYEGNSFGANPLNDNLYIWEAFILGPLGTPYEGGKFRLKIEFPLEYPYKPPKVNFVTRIFHCNINSNGNICLDILYDKWSPVLTTGKILLSITSLLSECNPEDPLVPTIANLYKANREKYDQTAREWTMIHATE